MKELEPITIEMVNRLKGFERSEAIRKYHEWLKRARYNDLRIQRNLDMKIFKFKNPERVKRWKENRIKRREEKKWERK